MGAGVGECVYVHLCPSIKRIRWWCVATAAAARLYYAYIFRYMCVLLEIMPTRRTVVNKFYLILFTSLCCAIECIRAPQFGERCEQLKATYFGVLLDGRDGWWRGRIEIFMNFTCTRSSMNVGRGRGICG